MFSALFSVFKMCRNSKGVFLNRNKLVLGLNYTKIMEIFTLKKFCVLSTHENYSKRTCMGKKWPHVKFHRSVKCQNVLTDC